MREGPERGLGGEFEGFVSTPLRSNKSAISIFDLICPSIKSDVGIIMDLLVQMLYDHAKIFVLAKHHPVKFDFTQHD